MLLAPHQFQQRRSRHREPVKPVRTRPGLSLPLPDWAPPPDKRKRSRVLGCLHQIESLNLARPEGVVVPDKTPDKKVHKEQEHLRQQSHSPRRMAARRKAMQAQDSIDNLLQQRRHFAKMTHKLQKKLTTVVGLVSNLSVQSSQNRLLQELRALPSLHEHIMQAMDDHHKTQREKLQDIKSALQMLRRSIKAGGNMSEDEMRELLGRLGSEKLLEVVHMSDGHHDASTLHDHVSTYHDVWLEADSAGSAKMRRRKSPTLRNASFMLN